MYLQVRKVGNAGAVISNAMQWSRIDHDLRRNNDEKLGKHGNAMENCLMNRFATRLLQMAIMAIDSLVRHPTSPMDLRVDQSNPKRIETIPNRTEQVQCH